MKVADELVVEPATELEEGTSLGEIIGDIDLRDLQTKARVTADTIELLIGDGDSAIVLTTSWTTKLEDAADRADTVAGELSKFAAVLRERHTRRSRPQPGLTHPEGMGESLVSATTPTQSIV